MHLIYPKEFDKLKKLRLGTALGTFLTDNRLKTVMCVTVLYIARKQAWYQFLGIMVCKLLEFFISFSSTSLKPLTSTILPEILPKYVQFARISVS